MPIQDPGIAVTARPVNTFTRQPDPSALQVADALAELNPKLTAYTTRRAEAWIDDQRNYGRERAIADAADWQARTVRGEAPLGHNLWYRRAYRQQAGQNEGRNIAAAATTAYAEWNGRDSDNPEDFQHFLAGFIRERTRGIHDPDVIAGLTPELGVLQNNLTAAHTAYTAARVEREGNDALSGAVNNAIDDSRTGPLDLQTGERSGPFEAGNLMQRYEELRDRFYAAGMNRSRFDQVFTQAVIDKSISDLDTSYLDMLEMPRRDGVPAISEKAGMTQIIADTRNQIESRAASHEVRSAQIAHARREQAAQDAFQHYAQYLLSGQPMTPQLQAEVATLGATGVIDVREFNELNRAWRQGIDAADNPVFAQSEDDLPPDLIREIYDRGNVQAVYQAWSTHIITDPALLRTVTAAAVSRREGEQNQDISRQSAGYRTADEERSAVTRALLPIFNQAYPSDSSNPSAGRNALNQVLDQYRPLRDALIDRVVEDQNVSAEDAATAIDHDVAAYISGDLGYQDFDAAYGDNAHRALVPFNPTRAASNTTH